MLIVDPDSGRRKTLCHGLAEHGYEVISAVGEEEGLKFARGLGPSVIVAPLALPGFGDLGVLASFGHPPAPEDGPPRPSPALRQTLVLFGDTAEEAADLPLDVLFLPLLDLAAADLVRRLRLVLLGREIGVEADVEMQSLVGEIALLPLLELVRSLARCQFTGRVELRQGTIDFAAGRVISAHTPGTSGLKAFCRLNRQADGPFHVFLDAVPSEPTIEQEVSELVIAALEDAQVELPNLRARVRLSGNELPLAELPAGQLRLLAVIDRCATVGELFDALPVADGLAARSLAKLIEEGFVKLERPRSAVTVMTDSTADLPQEMLRALDIRVVPVTVLFGEHAFRDGIDLQPRDFYQLLATSDVRPTTEPPSEAEFFEHFRLLVEEQDVVAVHLSSKLSQTVVNARQAALRGVRSFDHLPETRRDFALEIVDSGSVSVGLGLLALFAARMAHRGHRVYSICRRLRDMGPRLELLFAVDTLDYLVKGGRIGRARAAIGKLLGVKPILGVVEGEVTAVDRVRGSRQLHPRMIQLLRQQLVAGRPVVAAVAHAQAPVWADRLRRLVEESFEVREMIVSDIGPVVGSHTGPGTVGTVVFQPTDDEWPLIAPLAGDPRPA